MVYKGKCHEQKRGQKQRRGHLREKGGDKRFIFEGPKEIIEINGSKECR